MGSEPLPLDPDVMRTPADVSSATLTTALPMKGLHLVGDGVLRDPAGAPLHAAAKAR